MMQKPMTVLSDYSVNKNENMKSVKYSVYFGALLGVEEIDLQTTLAQYPDFLVLSVVAKGGNLNWFKLFFDTFFLIFLEKCFGFATFKSEETVNRLIQDKFITVGSKKIRVLPCASNKDSESKVFLIE